MQDIRKGGRFTRQGLSDRHHYAPGDGGRDAESMGAVRIEGDSMRNSIVIYSSWGKLMTGLSSDTAGALMQRICKYSFEDSDTPSDNETVEAMFAMIKDKLDDDAAKYAEVVNKRSEGGKKGMASRWGNTVITNDNTVITNDNTVITNDNTPITQITDTVSDTDTVSVSDKDKKSRRFAPPSLEEVRAYCMERNNNVDPEAFIDFYASKGWKVGNQTMKDWKASVRTWERRSRDKPTPKEVPKGHFANERIYDFEEIERKYVKGAK